MNNCELMDIACMLGVKLAESGAETYRIEESINRVVVTYGLQAQVYSVPNSLIITIIPPNSPPITQLCRIPKHTTNMEGIERFCNIGRRICNEKPALSVASQWLSDSAAQQMVYNYPTIIIGNTLAAAGFCIFFGGKLNDSICAGLCGLLLAMLSILMANLNPNVFFEKIIASFFIAMSAYTLNALGFVYSVDTVIIGPLMLLVPGLLFTNTLRDIIYGDTNAGINRFIEVLLIAAAIALGVAAAWSVSVLIYGEVDSHTALSHIPLLTIPAGFLACYGFVIVFNVHGKGKLLCALGSAITWAAYCLSDHLGLSGLFCCFLATIVATVFSEWMARIRKYPATSYLVISLLPLIPGAGIYYTAQQAVFGNASGFISRGTDTLATAGILIVTTVIKLWHKPPVAK